MLLQLKWFYQTSLCSLPTEPKSERRFLIISPLEYPTAIFIFLKINKTVEIAKLYTKETHGNNLTVLAGQSVWYAKQKLIFRSGYFRESPKRLATSTNVIWMEQPNRIIKREREHGEFIPAFLSAAGVCSRQKAGKQLLVFFCRLLTAPSALPYFSRQTTNE